MILSSYQERLLADIADLKVASTLKRDEFNREQLAREQAFRQTVDAPVHDAIYRAFKAGVPKRQIGVAYQTKDAGTINGILRKYTDNIAVQDTFRVTKDPSTEVYTVEVDMLANWSATGDQGKVLRDARVQFTLDEYSIPTFLGEDPWASENAPLARQIEMHAGSDHNLNVKIRELREA